MVERGPLYTVKQPLRVRLTIKRSRFIASLAPANTEQEAREYIASIESEFPDATHHTYAYRLGFINNGIERSSDAREPAGTAGPPMLQELNGARVTNVVVVATRYFGGIKLGIGGLNRAYRSCARACLEEARLVKIIELAYFKVILDYDDMGPAIRYIESCDGEILDIEYGEQVIINFSVPATVQQQVATGLGDVSRGRAQLS